MRMVREEELTVEGQENGFRFDIYERVHLPEGALGIDSLEEIELTPYIEIEPNDEDSLLKGRLRLRVVYQPEGDEQASQTFQQDLPVDISLPVRAINRGQVGVTIDQFDIELLSKRSINVTGVLCLEGVEQLPLEEGDDVRVKKSGPKKKAVHKPTHKPKAEEHSAFDEPFAFDEQQSAYDPPNMNDGDGFPSLALPTWEHNPQFPPASQPVQNTGPEQQFSQSHEPSMLTPTPPQGVDHASELAPLFELPQDQQTEPRPPIDNALENQLPAFPGDPGETPASGNHETRDEEPSKQNMVISFKSQRSPDAEQPAERNISENVAANNVLEWRSLFLSGEEKARFKQMRVCIVQKEDTLQSIAAKYKLNPREILLYNRLNGDDDLLAGQTIYIPK